MRPVVYDAGPLIAAERNDRRLWAEHRVRLELAIMPCVPAPIVAQVSRSPRQVQLRRLLRGCEVIPLDEAGAHLWHHGHRSSDRTDIQRLASKTGARLRIIDT